MMRAYLQDQRGAAAAEFALILGVFVVALPNVIDVGIYAYDVMQVQNSAQMGAQAIWAACNQLPATDATACPNASAALNAAVQRTSLGGSVQVSSVAEGYYCTDSTGALANAASNGKTGNFTSGLSSAVPSPPSDCSKLTNPKTSKPGDYIWVTVTYSYTPVFSASVMSARTIESTAWMRLL